MIERGRPRSGGLPLPAHAEVVVIPSPVGTDARRKLSVLFRLPYYLCLMAKQVLRADVVHTPVPGDMPLLGMLVALFLRKRLLVRYGGAWFPTDSSTAMNRVTRTLMRWFSSGRQIMFATGDSDRSPGGNVKWIFSTAISEQELAGIIPSVRDQLSVNPNIVFIGRLSSEKGVAVLIQAIALLTRENFLPLPHVRLVGDGPQKDELLQLVSELGCSDRVTFCGQLNRKHLADELSQADLCVQPSLTEGFSKAWLDAMAFGLPVIASNVGAASSVIGGLGERGWLVQPGDPKALTRCLREVLSNPTGWQARRVRCRAYVEARTLERWQQRLGTECAQRWQMRLEAGKLRW
jgi:glycosyltransferase involved in cell wall biosynthesis